MIRSDIKLTGNIHYDDAIYVVISCSAMALLGSIELDLTQGFPITLQSILVVLSGFLFGSRVGVVATGLYLLVGGLGAPVFHGGASGWLHFAGPTGGFLLSYMSPCWKPMGPNKCFLFPVRGRASDPFPLLPI